MHLRCCIAHGACRDRAAGGAAAVRFELGPELWIIISVTLQIGNTAFWLNSSNPSQRKVMPSLDIPIS